MKQASIAVQKLKETVPERPFAIKEISTKGDKIQDKPLGEIGGSGLFTKEIEYRLAQGNIDIAVHSLKDLPTSLDSRLKIGAVLPRANPSDVLINDDGMLLSQLPPQAVIGTGSARRTAQLLNCRPDLEVLPIRGNIDTRLQKLEKGRYDSLVLAAAGLQRMGWQSRISQYLPLDTFIPAAGQGVIALQIRAGDSEIKNIVSRVNDNDTEAAVKAERTVFECLNAGCKEPIGAFATWKKNELHLKGMVAGIEGDKLITTCLSAMVDQTQDALIEAEQIGRKAAEQLLNKGAHKLLQELRR